MYKKFQKLLDERGLKVSDVCKATGIPQGSLSTWKKRNGGLSYKNIKKLSEYFNVSPSYFMGYTEEQMKEYEEGYNDAMRLIKKYSVLYDIMLAGGTLLEMEEEKDEETTRRILEAYANALKAMQQKGATK